MIFSARRKSSDRRAGFTLLEVLVALSVFSIALAILGAALASSRSLLTNTSGSADATQTLRKVFLALNKDVKSTAFPRCDTANSLVAPGGGLTGDVFWCLSAEDPATGKEVRSQYGLPVWQRNIIYYTAVPLNHSALYGFTCVGGADANGYDVFCPHKVLIRKVVDSGTVTTPSNPATEEKLIPAGSIKSYLSAPTGFVVPLTGAGTEEARVVAPRLLTFQVKLAPSVATLPTEVAFKIQATALQDLGKSTAVGKTDLSQAPQTESMEFSLFPENK